MRQCIFSGQITSALQINTSSKATWGEFSLTIPAPSNTNDKVLPYEFRVYVPEVLIERVKPYTDLYKGEESQIFVIVEGVINANKTTMPDGRKLTEYTIRLSRINPSSSDCQINQVTLCGRMGAEPDYREFDSGSVRVELSIAVDLGKDQSPMWFNKIELWGQPAKNLAKYAVKGQQLFLQGYFRPSYFINRDEETVSILSFNMQSFQFGQKPKGYSNGQVSNADLPAGMADDFPAEFAEI